jgi:hypothetical protein
MRFARFKSSFKSLLLDLANKRNSLGQIHATPNHRPLGLPTGLIWFRFPVTSTDQFIEIIDSRV